MAKKFDSGAWLEFHKSGARVGLSLDTMPKIAAELKVMLESVAPGVTVRWGKVAAYLKLRHDDAPVDPMTYRRYAEKRFGWRE